MHGDRHVAPLVQTNRIFKQIGESSGSIACRNGERLLRAPIPSLTIGAVGLNLEPSRRRYAPDSRIKGFIAFVQSTVNQILGDNRPVRLRTIEPGRANRLDLGRKEPSVMDAMAEQGLDSKPVARADYFACTFIVNQKRPHAIHALHALVTPLVICV